MVQISWFPLAVLAALSVGGCAGPALDATLATYRLAAGPIEVEGIDDNLSGLCFDTESGRLLAVVNGPCLLLEMTTEGEVLRTFEIADGGDTEGVALVDGELAISDEGVNGVLMYARPGPADEELRFLGEIPVGEGPTFNRGPEGVAYDPAGDRLFVVKEKDPMQLYEVALSAKDAEGRPVVRKLWALEGRSPGVTDAAGLCYDPESKLLLVVSDEGMCVLACTPAGEVVGRLDLPKPPQAEGVALGPDGTIYVVGEPNLLYLFRP